MKIIQYLSSTGLISLLVLSYSIQTSSSCVPDTDHHPLFTPGQRRTQPCTVSDTMETALDVQEDSQTARAEDADVGDGCKDEEDSIGSRMLKEREGLKANEAEGLKEVLKHSENPAIETIETESEKNQTKTVAFSYDTEKEIKPFSCIHSTLNDNEYHNNF